MNTIGKKVIDLLNNVQTTIYPVIDTFIKSCLIILTDHHGWPNGYHCIQQIEHLDGILDVIKKEKQKLETTDSQPDHSTLTTTPLSSSQSNNWIEGFVKDIKKYLQRMKELETETSTKVLDIVPITGLTISRFVRLENELKTVLELWEHKLDPTQTLQGSGPTAPPHTITNGQQQPLPQPSHQNRFLSEVVRTGYQKVGSRLKNVTEASLRTSNSRNNDQDENDE